MVLLMFFFVQGANLTAATKQGMTPLHFAVKHGDMNIVRFLLDNGVDVNAKTNKGNTALHLSIVAYGILLGVPDMDSVGEKSNPIEVEAKVIQVMKLLIAAGANVKAENNKGNRPIQLAAQKGLQQCLTLLLDKGERADSKDSTGSTPLHTAAKTGLKDTVLFLLAKGMLLSNLMREKALKPITLQEQQLTLKTTTAPHHCTLHAQQDILKSQLHSSKRAPMPPYLTS